MLINSQYNNDIYAISPDIINNNGIHQNPILINKFSFHRILYFYLYNTNYYISKFCEYLISGLNIKHLSKNQKGFDKSKYISIGFGACYILTNSFFKKNSFLDDYCFLYNEETMFSNQIINSKGKIFYDINLKVKHFDNSSSKKVNPKRIYNYSRTSFWKSRKYFLLTKIKNIK